MEVDPARVCELLVGLGDVEVLSLDPPVGLVVGVGAFAEKASWSAMIVMTNSHFRHKNRRHFSCLCHRAGWTGWQQRLIMGVW